MVLHGLLSNLHSMSLVIIWQIYLQDHLITNQVKMSKCLLQYLCRYYHKEIVWHNQAELLLNIAVGLLLNIAVELLLNIAAGLLLNKVELLLSILHLIRVLVITTKQTHHIHLLMLDKVNTNKTLQLIMMQLKSWLYLMDILQMN